MGTHELEVTILNRQRTYQVSPRGLSIFLQRLARVMPPKGSGELAVCLVSDTGMRRYNRDFRGKDQATDVLSFPLGPEALGDIVISVPRAAAQARQRGHSLSREIKILLLHGYLHLLGYDHETDTGAMLRTQKRLLLQLLPRTSERAR